MIKTNEQLQNEIDDLRYQRNRYLGCVEAMERMLGKQQHETPYDAVRRVMQNTMSDDDKKLLQEAQAVLAGCSPMTILYQNGRHTDFEKLKCMSQRINSIDLKLREKLKHDLITPMGDWK